MNSIRLFWIAFLVVALCVFTGIAAFAQSTPISPGRVSFTCPDHADDTDHELGYFLAGAADPLQAVRLGDPVADANGVVTADVPARPLNIGQYELKIRAIAGTQISAWAAGGPQGDQPVPFVRAFRPPANLTIAR